MKNNGSLEQLKSLRYQVNVFEEDLNEKKKKYKT